jgi:hypothetical protein
LGGPRLTLPAQFLETELGVLLLALQLLLELLVAEGQLFDRAGELAELPLQPVEPLVQVGRIGLRHPAGLGRLLLLLLVFVAEETVQQLGGRGASTGKNQHSKRGEKRAE